MKHLLTQLKPYGINERLFTEDDFHRIREQEGVHLVEVPLPEMEWQGIYTVYRNVPTIAISANLTGVRRLHVLFHEMAHHWLHAPKTRFFSKNTLEKIQYEAEAVAAYALIPEPLLRSLIAEPFLDVETYPIGLLIFRLQLFDKYSV